MGQAIKKFEDFDETLALIEGHPLTQRLRAEKAAENLKQREQAAETIETLEKDAKKIIPTLQAELTAAEAELHSHDEARKVIQNKAAIAALALFSQRQQIDREKNEAENILLSTADLRIDEAIQFFRDKHDTLRVKSIDRQTRTGETNVYNLTKKISTYSNYSAIVSALNYCLTSIRTLERMKLEPVLDLARVETLKAGIPDTGEFNEIITDKPLPKDINPLHRLKSDSELDW